MRASNVKDFNIIKPEGVFTPIYSYLEAIPVLEDGEVVDYEYADFILNKTAEEVYQEYLNPLSPEPTEMDLMKQELVNVQEALDFMIMNGGI